MRIGIDARYISDHFPGIGRYVMNLSLALAPLAPPHTLVLLYNPHLPNTRHDLDRLRPFPAVEMVPTLAPPFSLREQWEIPRLARTLRLDLLHSPYYLKPYVGLPCPSVVTIYDLIGRRLPGTLSLRGRLLFNLTTWLALHTSQRIITISQSARDDILHSYRIQAERIAVTPLAADHRFVPQPPDVVEAVRAKYGLPPRYVLYLGANKPHKNLERLVRAWEQFCRYEYPEQVGIIQSGLRLVLAGHEDLRYPQVRRLVESRLLEKLVMFLPNVDDEDLPALYSGADIFVFPSLYEGFGLPPLEAMACGIPVLCARASSLPEVVGTAALTVAPHDIDEMVQGLRYLILCPSLREHLREKGLARARQFSWQRTARETLALYKAAVQGKISG